MHSQHTRVADTSLHRHSGLGTWQLTVNEVASTLSRVHIRAKDPTFQCTRLLGKVDTGSQFDEFDGVPPALDDVKCLGSCATAKFRERGVVMIVNASIAAAANADRIRNGAIVAAIARGVVGEIADIVIGPAVMSAISKQPPE